MFVGKHAVHSNESKSRQPFQPSERMPAAAQVFVHAEWGKFCGEGAAGAAPGGSRVRDGSPIGAKNLNLRRRMPLSPLNQNKSGGGREGTLKKHKNTVLGGREGVEKKVGDSGWSAALLPADAPRAGPDRIPAGSCLSPDDLVANRTRVKSEVSPPASRGCCVPVLNFSASLSF